MLARGSHAQFKGKTIINNSRRVITVSRLDAQSFASKPGNANLGIINQVNLPTPLSPPVLVSQLNPTPMDGELAFVTDSNVAAATNFGVLLSSGGTNHVPIWYDGGASAWKIG